MARTHTMTGQAQTRERGRGREAGTSGRLVTSGKGAGSECVDACLDCFQACTSTIQYCLERGGSHAGANHIKLMQDCADICRTAAAFVARDSRFREDIARLCAEICEACAKDCGEFRKDATMEACAEVCRHCAETCRGMTT